MTSALLVEDRVHHRCGRCGGTQARGLKSECPKTRVPLCDACAAPVQPGAPQAPQVTNTSLLNLLSSLPELVAYPALEHHVVIAQKRSGGYAFCRQCFKMHPIHAPCGSILAAADGRLEERRHFERVQKIIFAGPHLFMTAHLPKTEIPPSDYSKGWSLRQVYPLYLENLMGLFDPGPCPHPPRGDCEPEDLQALWAQLDKVDNLSPIPKPGKGKCLFDRIRGHYRLRVYIRTPPIPKYRLHFPGIAMPLITPPMDKAQLGWALERLNSMSLFKPGTPYYSVTVRYRGLWDRFYDCLTQAVQSTFKKALWDPKNWMAWRFIKNFDINAEDIALSAGMHTYGSVKLQPHIHIHSLVSSTVQFKWAMTPKEQLSPRLRKHIIKSLRSLTDYEAFREIFKKILEREFNVLIPKLGKMEHKFFDFSNVPQEREDLEKCKRRIKHLHESRVVPRDRLALAWDALYLADTELNDSLEKIQEIISYTGALPSVLNVQYDESTRTISYRVLHGGKKHKIQKQPIDTFLSWLNYHVPPRGFHYRRLQGAYRKVNKSNPPWWPVLNPTLPKPGECKRCGTPTSEREALYFSHGGAITWFNEDLFSHIVQTLRDDFGDSVKCLYFYLMDLHERYKLGLPPPDVDSWIPLLLKAEKNVPFSELEPYVKDLEQLTKAIPSHGSPASNDDVFHSANILPVLEYGKWLINEWQKVGTPTFEMFKNNLCLLRNLKESEALELWNKIGRCMRNDGSTRHP